MQKSLESIVVPSVRALIFHSPYDFLNFLMIKRGPGSDEGLWSLPGGKFDPGEKPFDAIAREISEEVGLREGHDYKISYHTRRVEAVGTDDARQPVFYFECHIVNGGGNNIKLDGCEAVEHRWDNLLRYLGSGTYPTSDDLAFNRGEGMLLALRSYYERLNRRLLEGLGKAL